MCTPITACCPSKRVDFQTDQGEKWVFETTQYIKTFLTNEITSKTALQDRDETPVFFCFFLHLKLLQVYNETEH